MVRDGRGRIVSDGNKLKKRLYLHAELMEEEPLRTIMAEIQQNQHLTGATSIARGPVSSSSGSGASSAGAQQTGKEAEARAPVTEGMSDRIEQLKRKASENAKKE